MEIKTGIVATYKQYQLRVLHSSGEVYSIDILCIKNKSIVMPYIDGYTHKPVIGWASVGSVSLDRASEFRDEMTDAIEACRIFEEFLSTSGIKRWSDL
ncbi:MAG: hypothetical protein ACRC7W_03600 [Fusobacteriaceae bacterium]